MLSNDADTWTARHSTNRITTTTTIIIIIVITHADLVRVCVCVCVSIPIQKPQTWQVNSTREVLVTYFKVKRSNVKASVRLHCSKCQSYSYYY